MLSINQISKQFNEHPVLQNIDFTLGPEETIVILGPSGCGKTTLLRLISGMDQSDTGSVVMLGEMIQKTSPDIAFILQNYGLLPWKTNLANVALGLKVQGVKKKQRISIARKQLAAMGLQGREKEYPAVLSGGEQQRVAIARAYASNPKLLLMDEPFSSLDAITREKLQDTLLETWNRSKVPYILVTHSVEEAVLLGKRILILAGNPASIKTEFGNPDCGSPQYRNSEAYYHLIQKIRHQMGAFW